MRYIIQILCLSIIFPSLMYGQFNDNFDDGNISANPTWSGDVNKFIVNASGELQLNDVEASTSYIHFPISIKSDFTWEMDITLNFAPSDNNKAKIYFFIDDINPAVANGYYIEIGENLSEDALRFYSLTDGIPTLIMSGEAGAMAIKPAQVSLKMDRVEGLWTISTDYNKQGLPAEEISFFDDTFDFLTEGFFGFDTKYTSSNATQFYLDNLKGSIFAPDKDGPKIVSYQFKGQNNLEVNFNESIFVNSLNDLILDVSPTANNLTSSTISGAQNNVLNLVFADNFTAGTIYTLQVSGLKDQKLNKMEPQSIEFRLAVPPGKGDLVINEILFDPRSSGHDFIEIINVSDKFLDLQGMVIKNDFKAENEETVMRQIFLEKAEIIAITDDTLNVFTEYNPPVGSRFAEMDIPTFNADEGNVTLISPSGEVIDAFDYSDEMHLKVIDVTKGISLERIFVESPSIAENFTSGVKSTNFATPGYKNANFRNSSAITEDILIIEDDVFSPNGDGDIDELIMLINLPDVGFLSTIQVFNSQGIKVRTIQANQLTGKEDISRWDGLHDDGTSASIGHYFIFFEAFKENGESFKVKKHVKLLDFF